MDTGRAECPLAVVRRPQEQAESPAQPALTRHVPCVIYAVRKKQGVPVWPGRGRDHGPSFRAIEAQNSTRRVGPNARVALCWPFDGLRQSASGRRELRPVMLSVFRARNRSAACFGPSRGRASTAGRKSHSPRGTRRVVTTVLLLLPTFARFNALLISDRSSGPNATDALVATHAARLRLPPPVAAKPRDLPCALRD